MSIFTSRLATSLRRIALLFAASAALLPLQAGAASASPSASTPALALAPQASLIVVHAFGTAHMNPMQPGAPLLELPDGSFYGTTVRGGEYLEGTMFHLSRDHVLSVLHDGSVFDVRPHGRSVRIGRSVFGVAGMPTARQLCGTIYRIDEDRTFQSLYHMDFGPGGCYPNGLTLGPDGALYGTATGEAPTAGGSGGVFRITADGEYSVVYDFRSQGGGYSPRGELVLASDGNFYGTTADSLFRLSPQGELTTLFTFSSRPDLGLNPIGALIQASDGRLYGTTNGDARTGKPSTVFATTLDGQAERIATLDTATVGRTYTGLLQARDGHLYGLTGAQFVGETTTVYRLTRAGRLSVVHQFVADRDGLPNTDDAPLIQARDGKLYGVASSFGPQGGGTIFAISLRKPAR